jgi:hypothetical protein
VSAAARSDNLADPVVLLRLDGGLLQRAIPAVDASTEQY